MPHQTPLITTIVLGLGLSFVFGALANRLRLSPLAGYLVAGVIIGPFTPGYVADQAIASQLAELGIILLMFGVGLHFSLRELLSVRAIAISGAIGQMILVSLIGISLARALGWSIGAGVVFGLALSVASTVVVLREMREKRLIQTEFGRIVVGWLIVEDIAMILTLVLIPVLAGILGGQSPPAAGEHERFAFLHPQTIPGALVLTVAKIATFVLVMLVVGRRIVPRVLHYAAHTGSRELFRLAVLALALGVAFGSAELFGVSFALGAFFGGMILAESQLSHQAAQETLPLRDAFAVLFFVSVGMLFDPSIVVREPMATAATFLIIVLGNTIAAFAILSAFRYPLTTALPLAISLSQIGEFSFILAGLGVQLQLLPENGRDLILAGALLSILANPVLSFFSEKAGSRRKPEQPASAEAGGSPKPELPVTSLSDHAVLVGYGRVGSLVGQALEARSYPFLVIDERQEIVDKLRARGIEAIAGAAARRGLLAAANLAGANWLISAIPNPFEAGDLIEQARAANPKLEIIARAHFDAEIDYLKGFGANLIVMGEREIARAITEHITMRLETSKGDQDTSPQERSQSAPPATPS
jgi:monovalent cation:H+ antiporter-2, CPA2 family